MVLTKVAVTVSHNSPFQKLKKCQYAVLLCIVRPKYFLCVIKDFHPIALKDFYLPALKEAVKDPGGISVPPAPHSPLTISPIEQTIWTPSDASTAYQVLSITPFELKQAMADESINI